MFRCVTLKAGLQKRLRLPAPASNEKEALSWLSRPFDGGNWRGLQPSLPRYSSPPEEKPKECSRRADSPCHSCGPCTKDRGGTDPA